MKRVLTMCLLLCLPASAVAQAERFELGQRLRAFEASWDEHADSAARKRAIQPLKQAVTSFFAFRFGEAGAAFDEARRAVQSETTASVEIRWAESLVAKPEARLVDPAQLELPVTLAAFYPVEGTPPREASCRLTLAGANGKAVGQPTVVAIGSLPQEIKLPIKGLAEGDYAMRVEVLVANKAAARSEQALSLVPRLGRRLDRLTATIEELPKMPLTTDRETVRGLLRLLQTLAQNRVLETNYPAAGLLGELEKALKDVAADQPHFGQKRPGQFWLTLVAGKSSVPVRLQAPEAVKRGEPLPLVIALHGAGGSENLFFDGYGRGAIMPLCQKRGWLLVAPRFAGFGPGVSVPEVIEGVSRLYPVDPKRVFLVGHSMGAALALNAAQQAPERFAGVAALGGGGLLRKTEAVQNVPFFIGIGQQDFALRTARNLHDSLKSGRVKQFLFREYEDIEHLVIVQAALGDVFQFFDEIAGR